MEDPTFITRPWNRKHFSAYLTEFIDEEMCVEYTYLPHCVQLSSVCSAFILISFLVVEFLDTIRVAVCINGLIIKKKVGVGLKTKIVVIVGLIPLPL